MFSGKRILIVGDSHPAGAPGRALTRLLTAAGAASVDTWAEVGWGPTDWLRLRGDALVDRLREERPDVVLWWFGSNDPADAATREALGVLRALSADIGAQSWYLGPPAYPERADLEPRSVDLTRMARNVFGFWRFVDNRGLTRDLSAGRPDGVHFDQEAAELWAGRIMGAFKRPATMTTLGVIATAAAALGGYLFFRPRRRS